MESAELTNLSKSHDLDMEIACPNCEGSAAVHWKILSFWKCSSCNLIFRYPLPLENRIIELYEKSWTSPSECRSETGGTELSLARSYARKLADALELPDFGGLRILDFGAGRGDALTALSELGADVYGVEPFGYQRLVDKGFKVFRTLDEIPEQFTFDGIITMDVVEHLRSPWDEINRFGRMLNEGGFIYISTPNADSLRAKIEGENWREALRPGHFVLFTGDSLETVLDRAGYENRKRLRWYIKYNKNNLNNLLSYFLQMAQIDGELRYLIRLS